MKDARNKGSIGLAGLTPLVDTLFILLFSLLALSDSRKTHTTEQVRIQLPEVEPAEDGAGPNGARIVLEIGADSKIRVGESALVVESREELDRVLDAYLGDRLPEEFVVDIQADRDARHGVAVELLQHVRLRGFVNVDLIAVGNEELGTFGGGR